jgi:hypothetical protein
MIAHDKYRLAHRLGSGGMADVFRAEITGAEGFSRPVAIKRLHAGVSADPEFCDMFVREARLLATLQHPNIVSVLDFEWDAESRLFLVMELVDGVNLAQLVRGGQLPVPAAVHVTAEVLRGLGHAHARGILHRDVTPHNVLLAWTGEIKLSDFGLAKVSASSRVSSRGSIQGKVPYLSPEQLQGLTIDARSDLFSVGVMAYQLLTGRYPFFGRGDHPTMAEAIARMLTAIIVPPRDLRPEIPLELSDVVMRLLDRDREQRYAGTEQVLAALPGSIEGREAVAALLAEHFPAGAGESEAEPSERAGTPHPPRPAAQRHTTSLQGAPLQGGPERASESRPRWHRSALLLVSVVPLLWLAADQRPLSNAGEATGPAVASTRLHETEAAGAAEGAWLTHADAGVVPADAGLQRCEATTASMAARVDDPAAGRHTRSARPRRASARLSASGWATVSASVSTPGTATGLESDEPPEPPAAAVTLPDTSEAQAAPVRPPYERGWTEARPQQSITGDVLIRRRERR